MSDSSSSIYYLQHPSAQFTPEACFYFPSICAALQQVVDASGAMANPMYQSAGGGKEEEDLMATADSMGGDYGQPPAGPVASSSGGLRAQSSQVCCKATHSEELVGCEGDAACSEHPNMCNFQPPTCD
jgi:hypothetical protein